MTKTKWDFSQKTLTKTKSKLAVKINTGFKLLHTIQTAHNLQTHKNITNYNTQRPLD